MIISSYTLCNCSKIECFVDKKTSLSVIIYTININFAGLNFYVYFGFPLTKSSFFVDSNMDDGFVCRLRGLPWSATADDVTEFFGGIHKKIIYNYIIIIVDIYRLMRYDLMFRVKNKKLFFFLWFSLFE